MKETLQLKLSLQEAQDEGVIKQKAAQQIGWAIDDIIVVPIKRSIDARGRVPIILLQVEVYKDEKPITAPPFLSFLQNVHTRPSVIIVGAGPAGYFAALELIELGLRPIILDRGKDVQARRRDLKAIQQDGIVNPHSNYCFGEGGAGTYSDGKLYTRSVKRGNWWKVLSLLVEHGANSDILVEAHPHIGSNKLPQIVTALRETIEKQGGEVHFNAFVTDFLIEKGRIEGVLVNNETEYRGEAVILATGHSARDIYTLLHRKGIEIEAKPFALGVRIEHPQALIDEVQYKQKNRDDLLPAAPYKLVCQVGGRGVFSFCMCPGGLVVPAATSPGEIVVNGMSMSRRDSKYANSGTVTSVELSDLAAYQQHGVFAGMEFQALVEQTMFRAGDGSQKAPTQRLTDFVKGKLSPNLPDTSYIPGVFSAPLHQLLPSFIAKRLMTGVGEFGKQMRGYYTEEAVVIGTESRTSSPIRIPRNPTTLQHTQIVGLFPCGEGAGFAGGILSAAMDGQNVAKAVVEFVGGG